MENILISKEEKKYQYGFILLILFCLFRPIALLDLNIGMAGLNFFEIFAIAISYLFVVAVSANFNKLEIDMVSLTIIIFCFYCFISMVWGSNIRVVAQVVLPFVMFFSVRLFVKNQMQIAPLLWVIIIAYLIPLFGSLFEILQGDPYKIEYLTGIERHAGLFNSIRPMANAMFFFSVFFYLKYVIFRPENREIRYFLIFLLLISIFCLFKTYTRSIFIGLFIFWAFALLGFNKKYFLIYLLLALVIAVSYQSNLQQIFLKNQEFEINTASSGRAMLWEHNIGLFKTYSFERKFLGEGLGAGTAGVIGEATKIWSSHNDYLHLLMHLGIVGLFLYLLIFIAILKDIYFSKVEKRLKYFFGGFIFSIIFINFASGIITYQLATAQIFWTVMGFYYIFTLNLKTSMKYNQ